MDVMYKGTCTSTSHRMDSWVNSAPSAQADAQCDHRRRQARRAEVAHADAADHRRGRQACQRGGDPVAAEQADEGAVAHAQRPAERQHHVQVRVRGLAGERRPAGRGQHHDARGADQRFQRQPQQEGRLGAAQGDQRGDHQRIDDAAEEDRQGAEQAAQQGDLDIGGHVAAGLDQPFRQAPCRQAVDPILFPWCLGGGRGSGSIRLGPRARPDCAMVAGTAAGASYGKCPRHVFTVCLHRMPPLLARLHMARHYLAAALQDMNPALGRREGAPS